MNRYNLHFQGSRVQRWTGWLFVASRCLGFAAEPAGDWPQWRGPTATGVSPTADPPIEWSETKNIRWKLELPGKGHSSPIVWGDRVYVMAARPIGEPQKPVFDSAPGVHDSVPVTQRHEYFVTALARTTGHPLWQTVVREAWPHEGGHTTGSPVSGSPTTDGRFIYAFFGSRGLYCLNTNGSIVWRADLGQMQTLHAHGEGSSPVIHRDLLLVNWDHEGASFLYAFERLTGKIRWKTARDEKTSWSTPLLVDAEGRPQLVISATGRVRGYDPGTGSQLWECAGLTDNVVASPVFHRGLVIAGNSYYAQSMLGIRVAGARGDVSGSTNVVWRLNRMTPYVASPLLYGDTLYYLRHNQNILVRLDPATGLMRGEPLRLEGIRDFIFASPVGGGGRIYVTGRDGTTVVLRHDATNATVRVNHLDDSFSASAALAGTDLFLRGEKSLYAIGSQ